MTIYDDDTVQANQANAEAQDDATRTLRSDAVREDSLRTSSSGTLDGARFAPGTILAGRYRLVAMLGRGGMGEVYRAEDLKLGEPVALKFLPEHLSLDAAALARFHREVRVARQIAHRNVCRVHDIGEAEGYHFLTMEYIDGEDLSTLLRRIGRLPEDKAAELAGQICRGLAAAHEAGVLHRDLKPANVMIDGRGRAKITDFGLASLQEELKESDQDHFAGTPAYMAPEQLRGGELTPRTDVYALGLVLYELFTGTRAFPEEDWRRLVARGGRGGPPPDPASHVGGLDPSVSRALLRCLEEDPGDRPRSALEVASSLPGGDPLRAALDAGETPSPEMVAGFSRRVALSPAVGGALLALTVVAYVGWQLASPYLNFLGMADLEKHPRALEERAETLLEELEWPERGPKTVADTAWSFWQEGERIRAADAESLAEWRRVIRGRPALVTFFYRSSAYPLMPPENSWVPWVDRPAPRPGDALVVLDPAGRLERLRLNPPGSVPRGESPGNVDWTLLFSWAELDLSEFEPLEWTGPDGSVDLPAHDTRYAWQGTLDGNDVRIRAASFGSLPVFFELRSVGEVVDTTPQRARVQVIMPLSFLAVLGLACFAAARNVRSGRGDVGGAVRFGTAIAVVGLAGNVVATHHVGGVDELTLLFRLAATSAFRGLAVVILYLAMEPAIRRRCPDLIVSWTRLLKGRWNDPLVGRDVLIGFAVGPAAIFAAFALGHLLSVHESPWAIYGLAVKLNGLGPSAGIIAVVFFSTTGGTLAAAWVLSLLNGWVGRRWLAVALLIVLGSVLSGVPTSALILLGLLGTVGVLATVCAWMASDFVIFYPATADPSDWWAWPNAWLMPACVLLMAILAFRNATGLGTSHGIGERAA